MFGDGSILDWALNFAFVAIMAGMAIAFIRLARGPSMPDRVVALDLITVLAVAFCAVYAIASDEPAFLDVAIALALVAFLATVAFARFVEGRSIDGEPPRETGGEQ